MKYIAIFFLAAFTGLRAQNPNLEYKTAVKIYNISTLELYPYSAYIVKVTPYESYRLQILHPTFAVQVKGRKHNFHELELTRLDLNKSHSVYDVYSNSSVIRGGGRTVFDVALRYEYIFSFLKKKDTRLVPSLGLGIAPSFLQSRFEPESASAYPISSAEFAVGAQIIPRLNYHVNSRVYLDVNAPYTLAEWSFTSVRYEHPAIPEKQQKTFYYEFDALRQFYSLRIGIGVKI